MNIKIIGAGPGGLITGLKLIEAGYQPTILEKNDEITTTLCGEGLSEDTLQRVPFQDWSKFSPSHLSHATFILPEGNKLYVKKKCYTMDRLSWFKAMAEEFENRGGKIEFGSNVEKPNEVSCDLLIAADGPLSKTARFVGNEMKYIGGVQYRMKSDYEYDGMEFFLDKRYSEEYSWIFPKGDTLNVGLLGSQNNLEQFIKDKGLSDDEIIEKKAYNISFFGNKIQKDNIILTGDAAGITNPLTKGGMAAIIYISEIIVDCLKNNNIKNYQKKVFSHPVMAKEYVKALQYFRELDNEFLEKIGKYIGNKNIGELSFLEKLKIIMFVGRNPSRMWTMMKAAGYANKYSW